MSSESDASSDQDSGSAFDGSDASDDDDDAMSGGDESGDDWEQLEQKALKCTHVLARNFFANILIADKKKADKGGRGDSDSDAPKKKKSSKR